MKGLSHEKQGSSLESSFPCGRLDSSHGASPELCSVAVASEGNIDRSAYGVDLRDKTKIRHHGHVTIEDCDKRIELPPR